MHASVILSNNALPYYLNDACPLGDAPAPITGEPEELSERELGCSCVGCAVDLWGVEPLLNPRLLSACTGRVTTLPPGEK